LPQSLPDLLHGQSTLASVRYKLPFPAPCTRIFVNCAFDTAVSVTMPDVLDKVDPNAAPVATRPTFLLGPLR